MIDDAGQVLTLKVFRNCAFEKVSRFFFQDEIRKSVQCGHAAQDVSGILKAGRL